MDARLVASRLPGIPMYGQPFNAPPFPGYLPYNPADASAFYSPLSTGENADVWRAGLTQAAAAAYYDPTFAAHYGYGYGPMGLSDGARRKNATRETTSTLKAWLNEHRKNPYPTKGEKIMLAIITKMTLTQVSTWFANARRRLKKENKMTWSPRNRCGEDDDDDVMDGDDDNNLNNNSNSQMSDGQSNERSVSRSSTPNPQSSDNGGHRVSGFDLPHQNGRHPFLPRPEITGTFTIQGAGQRLSSDNSQRRSGAEDDEEIDLESVDDDKKDISLAKRSLSTDSHHNEEAVRRDSRSPPIRGPTMSNVTPHPAFLSSSNQASTLLHRHSNHTPGQGLHPAFGPVNSKVSRRDSASPRSHPYSRNAVPSPTSSVASASSASSPSKPRIWSLADVATSNDSAKGSRNEEATSVTSSASASSLFGGRMMPPHPQNGLNPEAQATIRNWMDGMMQQKMAAAAAAAAAISGGQAPPPPPFFPTGLLPQHLAAALNPAALAVAASLPREGVRFPHAFPAFAELAAAQRAQMAPRASDIQSGLSIRTTSAPLTPTIPNKSLLEAGHRQRIISGSEEKLRSPTSSASSPPHSDGQGAEISCFSALNNRPESSDSGIASAETSKENLSHSNESK